LLDLAQKKVLVVGLGRSGLGAARLCLERGARVTATDNRRPDQLAEVAAELGGRATLELGGHREESFVGADLIVLSPGVPELPQLAAARRRGVPVLGELELAFRFVDAPLVAITGTNGKSTTTSLLGAMVEASGRPTFVGGNLGCPLSEAVGTPAAALGGALVVEVSSFQLETIERFRPQVALLLNLSEDHLDRYPGYTDYVAAKARIFEQQTAEDYAVVNGEPDQRECRTLASGGWAQVLTFQVDPPGDPRSRGAWCEGGELVVRVPGNDIERLPRALLGLAGRHNLQNALAALLGARLFGVDLASCGRGLERFTGLPHRMELVAERGDVRFYNDSKATNVGSVVGSLTGFERKVVLIAGGKDKGGDYGPLLPLMGATVREVVLIGAAADRIEAALGDHVPVHRAPDLSRAVVLAAQAARPGEAVVLSPACSSFDMFGNFEERGEVFAEVARRISGGST
jgi:UDP-N-acetylmuramoylalanine--D-glutamate ligase